MARVLGAGAGLAILDDTIDQVHDVGQDMQAIVVLVAGWARDGRTLGDHLFAAPPRADLIGTRIDAIAAAFEHNASMLGAELQRWRVGVAHRLPLEQHEGVVAEIQHRGRVVVHRDLDAAAFVLAHRHGDAGEGGDPPHRPEQPGQRVQIIDRDVAQRAAARLVVPARVHVRQGVIAGEARALVLVAHAALRGAPAHPTDRPCREQLADRGQVGPQVGAQVLARRGDDLDAVGVRGGDQLVGLGHRDGHGLLHVDMLAGGSRRDGDRGVGRDGRRDQHDVHIGPREQFAIIAVVLRYAESLGSQRRALGYHVAHRLHHQARPDLGALEVGQDVAGGHDPAADHGCFQLVVHVLGLVLLSSFRKRI